MYGLRSDTDATDIGIQSRTDVAERIIGMLTRQYHVPLKAKRLIWHLSFQKAFLGWSSAVLLYMRTKIVAKKETLTIAWSPKKKLHTTKLDHFSTLSWDTCLSFCSTFKYFLSSIVIMLFFQNVQLALQFLDFYPCLVLLLFSWLKLLILFHFFFWVKFDVVQTIFLGKLHSFDDYFWLSEYLQKEER